MEEATAADKLGVSMDKLKTWETSGGLSVAQLRKASEVYKRPLAVFYLPAPPKDFKAMNDFRRLPGVPPTPTWTLLLEMRKVAARREIADELADDLEEEVPTFALASEDESAGAAAARIRRVLGIEVADQFEWKDDYEALNAWRSAIERLGVLVFQISGVEVEETRGFSAFSDRFPVIALNSKDAPVARSFTLMHELGHLVLRKGAMCDLHESTEDPDHDVEAWCNWFAGELLVPSDALKAVAASFRGNDWPDESLRTIARRFRVSIEVALRRLVAIERASLALYKRWRTNYLPPPVKKSKGGPTVPVRMVANAGAPYLGLVLSAYHSDRISASTAASYLDAKLKHIPAIEALLLSGKGAKS